MRGGGTAESSGWTAVVGQSPQPREEVAHSINVADWASIVRPSRRAILTARPVRSARPSKPHGRQRLLRFGIVTDMLTWGPTSWPAPTTVAVDLDGSWASRTTSTTSVLLPYGWSSKRAPPRAHSWPRSALPVARPASSPNRRRGHVALGQGVGVLVADSTMTTRSRGLTKVRGPTVCRRRRDVLVRRGGVLGDPGGLHRPGPARDDVADGAVGVRAGSAGLGGGGVLAPSLWIRTLPDRL